MKTSKFGIILQLAGYPVNNIMKGKFRKTLGRFLLLGCLAQSSGSIPRLFSKPLCSASSWHFSFCHPQTTTNMQDNHSYIVSCPRKIWGKRKDENGENALTGKNVFSRSLNFF